MPERSALFTDILPTISRLAAKSLEIRSAPQS
jgi:hypothetical protein